MMDKFCSGVIYPIPPVFNDTDYLDASALRHYLKYLSDNDAKIILVTAGTARFNMLSNSEMLQFNEVCSEFDGVRILGLPPMAECHLNQFIIQANALKPDAALLMYPDRYYSDTDIVGYFFRSADKLEIPVMIHGMFMRHATAGGTYNFQPGLVEKLKTHPNIIGMKEESTTYDLAYTICRCADSEFLVFPAGGSCRRYLLTYPAGAQNFLGGIGNIYPQIEDAFYNYIKAGDTTKAHAIVKNYEDPLFEAFGQIGWHMALQEALRQKKALVGTNRAPFAEIEVSQAKVIQDVLHLIETRLNTVGL